MKKIEEILNNPYPRPEPSEVSKHSQEDIVEAVLNNPEFIHTPGSEKVEEAVDRVLNSQTYKLELPNLLPYIEELVIEIMRNYSGNPILFAARDAEPFYDALKVVLYGDEREKDIRLVPASQNLITNMVFDLKDESKVCAIKKFLKKYAGINIEKVSKRNKFLLYDSGFRGSIGHKLGQIITKLKPDLKKAIIDTRVVAVDSSYDWAQELKVFEIESDVAEKKFPKSFILSHGLNEGERYNDNVYLAVALQLLPRYHEKFIGIENSGSPRISDSARTSYIDNPDWCNASIVSPFAAIMVQKKVAHYFEEKKDYILKEI